MAQERISIREWIKKFDNLDFSVSDVKVQIEAGWFDWFCNDDSLCNKTKSLGKKVKQLAASPKVNQDSMYVFFKNNCPMNGPLYDSFSFCDMNSDDVIFWVTPKSGHTGKAEVFGKENDFDIPLAEGNWKDIKNFFGI